ncbi:MAG: ammonium transporter [Eubacteriales bacterium]
MPAINSGDTAFMMLCCAMVFLMTPGLALFYGGMVRRKNVLNTLMSSFFVCGLASLLWIFVGYSLSFGASAGGSGIIGDFSFLGLANIGDTTAYAPTIPSLAFVAFQMMFAIITPALITGALAERMRFSALVVFLAVWSVVVYYPLTHMLWGADGFLHNLGAVDFAGGLVVHVSSGVSGLVACIMLGKRKGHGVVSYKPHNLPLIFIGAGLLWFGWFGFNGGSALTSGSLAFNAFMATNTSAAAAMLSWMLLEKIRSGKPSMLGAVTGAVVGLATITQSSGFVSIWSAAIIGAVASPVCFITMSYVKKKFGFDDALDAFGCHGAGGIWGCIATGLFAQSAINPAAQWNGLFFGSAELFWRQLVALGITIALAAAGTFVILSILRKFMQVRVSEREESDGLDHAEHGESAYPAFTGLDQ